MVKQAVCAFDVLILVNTIAAVAADINDDVKTSRDVTPTDVLSYPVKNSTHKNVYVINIADTLEQLLTLATVLADAANDCAATMAPNLDAVCAASIMGLLTSASTVAAAETLIAPACHEEDWYGKIPEGPVPSNVGSNERYEEGRAQRLRQRQLQHENREAPARSLLYGGGKGSLATQCFTHISDTLYALAAAAISINSAGNTQYGGTCPPKDAITGKERPSSRLSYRGPQAACTADVTGAILGFVTASSFIQNAVVSCSDTLNLEAICGSAVAQLVTALDSMASTGTGVWLSCPGPGTARAAASSDRAAASGGRRLLSAEEAIEELRRRYGSPEEAFRSFGYDLGDASASWRRARLAERRANDPPPPPFSASLARARAPGRAAAAAADDGGDDGEDGGLPEACLASGN